MSYYLSPQTPHRFISVFFSLLVISQLLPDLLKLSPNNSFQSPQNTPPDTIKQEHTEHLATLEDVEVTRTSSVWHQPATKVDTKQTEKEKNYLIGTEIALARTIHNYNNKQRSLARKPSRQNRSCNEWPHTSVKCNTNFASYKGEISQSKPRPHSGISNTQRKPSVSKRITKSCTLSALHGTSNTNTAKDLELLTKSITQQLSVKNKNSLQQSVHT